MATATAPPVTPKTTTSAPTNPIYQAAVAQAKAALAAAQQPIQDEQAQSDAAFKQRQTDATGEAASLAELLKGIGPTVQGAYSTAAQNQGLLANGFSDGMKDKLQGNTDSLNAMLAKLGSPTQLDSHAQQAGDVLYGLGGYNPGSTFNREGAAFGAAADMLPGTALLKGQENVKSLQGQAITADQGFQNKLAELAGQLPGQIQDNYSKLQTLALNDQKFALAIKHENFTEAMAIANNKLAAGRLNLDSAKYQTGIDEFNTKTKLDYQKLSLQSQKMAQQQFNANRDYGIKLANLGIANKRLQLAVTAASFKAASGGLSQKDVSKYTSEAQSIAMDGMNGHTVYTTVNGVKTASTTPQLTFAESLQKILAKGVPVQIALSALDRVYPADQRPTPAILARELGPLDPQALKQVAANNAAMAALMPGYNQMVGVGGGPTFKGNPGALHGVRISGPLVGVKVEFANTLAAAARAAGATAIQITSGRRNAKQNAAVGGVSSSNHLTGDAIDGRALINGKWVPLGALSTLSRFGIRSGDQPGFFNGKPDPYHVDDGANVSSGLTGARGALKRYAFSMATNIGWNGADIQALDRLWTRESGWNPQAKNPSSGALGIPQALGHKLPPGYDVDPQAQIDWGINYIKQRYGTPSKAWQHETRYGWY